MAPRLSVLVPVYEQWHLVPKLLARLEAQTLPQDQFEVILADNGLTELKLAPKKADDLKSITLLVAEGGEVKRLVVLDDSGNQTTFTFTQRTAGKKRPATDFALEPPRGTKVVTD